MFSLIGNENVKIYRRLRTWIMAGILLLAIVLVAVVIVSHQGASSANWQHALQTTNTRDQQTLVQQGKHMPAAAVSQLKAQIQLNQYYLVHNIDPNRNNGWSFASTAENLSTLLIAFILVVAGDIVASEFSTGTIKMLLTQTATRTKILTSKLLSMLLYGLLLTAFMFAVSLIVGWIFFGFAGAGVPHLYVDAHQHIQQMSTAAFLLMEYGFLLVQIIITATIAFMISAIFRSSALAITISLLAFLIGNTLVGVLSSFAWVKYVLFANTNLLAYVVGGPEIHGLTLGFSISMLVAYFIVMVGLSWVIFVRRDVAYT